MAQKVNKIIRIYDKEKTEEEIFFDVYELILAKLDNELLVKEL